MKVKCCVCGREYAVYIRRDSGEALCASCLGKSLERRVRKSISETLKLKPGSTVILLASPELLVESLVLTKILYTLERRYSSTLIVASHHKLIRNFLTLKSLLNYEFGILTLSKLQDINVKLILMNKPESLTDIALNIINMLESGAKIIVTPITADDIAEALLYSIIHNEAGNANIILNPKPLVITYAFKHVLRADVYAYAYLSGILEGVELNTELFMGGKKEGKYMRNVLHSGEVRLIKSLITELSFKHPELIYRFIKFMPRIIQWRDDEKVGHD